jgi:hypothetical protein
MIHATNELCMQNWEHSNFIGKYLKIRSNTLGRNGHFGPLRVKKATLKHVHELNFNDFPKKKCIRLKWLGTICPPLALIIFNDNILQKHVNRTFYIVETTLVILVHFKLKSCWKKLFVLFVTNIIQWRNFEGHYWSHCWTHC